MMKKLLVFCGISAALLYTGTVILGGLIRPGYSHVVEAISELVADGAPNRPLLSSLFLLYNTLLGLFGWGLFLKVNSQPQGRTPGFIASLTLFLVGLAGVLMELAFPQDPGGVATTFAGTMHLVMAGIASLGTMAAVLGSALWFRKLPGLKNYAVYSFISVAIIFISGGFTAMAMANKYQYFGAIERITIGTFILWVFVIALRMVRQEQAADWNRGQNEISSMVQY